MKQRRFLSDITGISVMYDAVFFIIMVTLAGVVLLPVVTTQPSLNTLVDKHREDIVDDALHTFLVSRADLFHYRFCGTLLDTVAKHIGINTTDHGLYTTLTEWFLAHEQHHKTYATLLSENLGCQFFVPFRICGLNRINIFTEEYDSELKNDTKQFFVKYFGEKYRFNLSAWWHPIKAISFGGGFWVGECPPPKDCYVARRTLMMPYPPVICFDNKTIILTKHWVRHQLFDKANESNRSSIPLITNITTVFEKYCKKVAPFNDKTNASMALKENLTVLVCGFLINGITNETNHSVFPGIIPITMGYGFEKIKLIANQFFENAVDDVFGGSIRTMDGVFGGLNSSMIHPLSQAILDQLNTSLHDLLNQSFPSLSDAFDAFEDYLKEYVTGLLLSYLDYALESLLEHLLDIVDSISAFIDGCIDWLFDQLCLNKAEVMLTVWVVRE